MRQKDSARRQQQLEIRELRARLEEAEQALRAIRCGAVDAVVVSGPQGDQIYTLKGAEQPYRILVETMNEGTLTLLPDRTISYSNSRFSETLRMPLEKVTGSSFAQFLPRGQQPVFETLLEQSRQDGAKAEFTLLAADGVVPVQISVRPLADQHSSGFCLVITNLTEQKRAEHERTYLAAIVESSEDAIIGKRLDGTIVSWNHGAERLYGYQAEEVIGRSVALLLPPGQPDELPAILEKVRLGELIEHYETERVRKDGTRVYVSLRFSPLKGGAAGAVVGASTIARDITYRKRAEDEIKALNTSLERRVAERTAELTAANKELEAFACSVAHDLRSPLRGMDGFSLALLEDYGPKLDEQAQNYLKRIRAAAVRMGELIDDLLNLSRIWRSEVRRERVDLSALALAVVSDLQKSEPERPVEFVIEPGLAVEGDPRLLRVALDNLLGNAWKFSAGRQPARIEFGVTDSKGRRAYFVRDNGVGFDMAYAGKLFAPFQRLHSMTEFPGTGIGLATVQRVVRKHGGEVWTEAALGQGATFYFTLGEGGK